MSKKVVFFSPFGSFHVHNQLDAVVAAALRVRGHSAIVLGCDGLFSKCDVLAWSGENAKQDCANCAASGKQFFNAFGLEPTQLRSYLVESDYIEARTFAESQDPENLSSAQCYGVPIGKWVTSSIFSYFRITASDLDRPEVRTVHKEFLANGWLTYRAMSRFVEAEKPDHAVAFNGRFAPYRIAFEVFRSKGVPVVCHERGFADDTFINYSNFIAVNNQPIHDCYATWRQVPLDSAELARVKEYFGNREKGKDTNFTPFVRYSTDYEVVCSALRVPPQSRILGVFTSSEYEVAYHEDYQSPVSQLDLIDRLIDLFRGRNEYLVIRHHPYIAGDKMCPPDYRFIDRAYTQMRSAPENVRVIMPAEKLSSYALFWNIDGCIAPLSSTGLEAAARGVAGACFEQSPFREGMFRQIADFSSAGLSRLVEDVFAETSRGSTEIVRNAYRFQNSMISKLSVRFESFGIKNHFQPEIRIQGLEQLLPGHDPSLDRLLNHIESGISLLPLPAEEHLSRSQDVEGHFVSSECDAIRSQRSNLRAERTKRIPQSAESRVCILGLTPLRSEQAEMRMRLSASEREPFDGDVGSLLNAVRSTTSSFLCIGHPAMEHDSAFLSTAVDYLSFYSSADVQAVWQGGWIVQAERIRRSIFTENAPAENYESALRLLPAIGDWRVLLAFFVFRRGYLEGLLDSAEMRNCPGSAALFEKLRLVSHRTLNAALIVRSDGL